jgi:sulfur carrier protein
MPWTKGTGQSRPGLPEPIWVKIEPDQETKRFKGLNTVLQLLNRLGLRVNSALIIREGQLLTPDQRLNPGDQITVRLVTSRG